METGSPMSNSSEEEKQSILFTKCKHENGFYTGRTREDYFDGGEEDEYYCNDCQKYVWIYVPR